MGEHVQINKVFAYGTRQNSIEDVISHFQIFGPLKNIESLHDQEYVFVEFFDEVSVQRALEQEEQHIGNQRIIVKRAFARGIRRQNSQSSNHSSSDAISAPGYKIFVGGLPHAISNEEFRSYFERFGTVTDSIVIRDHATNVSRGFGFVSFDSAAVAQHVLWYRFLSLNGTVVEVKAAVPQPERSIAPMPCFYAPVYPPYYPITAYQPPTYAYDPNWYVPDYGYLSNGYYGYASPQNIFIMG